MKVLLEAPILTQSGYGEHSRLVYRALQKAEDVELYINPLNWGTTGWISEDSEERKNIDLSIKKMADITRESKDNNKQPNFDLQIHVGIVNEFTKKAPYSICVTAGIETDRISPEWVVQTHRGIDKIIVPSVHAAKGFQETSFEVVQEAKQIKTILSCKDIPVEVVPYPVKEITPHDLNIQLETKFNFLSIALFGPRKNLENMIKWFVEEFKDDPETGLLLKVSKSSGSIIDKEYTKKTLTKTLSNYPDRKCKVYLLHGDLTEQEMHSLYLRDDIHAYITATHGEGYGLPIFEAAYSGLPIVATNWSGHLDFLSAEYKESGKKKEKQLFAKVDYELKEIPKEAVWDKILIKESKWAYPKQSSFKSQLRKMKQNHGMYKKWASVLKDNIQSTHSSEQVIDTMKNSLISHIENIKKEQNEIFS